MRTSLLLIPLAALALAAAGCGGADHPAGEGAGAAPAGSDASRRAGNIGALEAGWKTDFRRHSVPLEEFVSGGPGKDGIPAIDRPRFESVEQASSWIEGKEPVIELVIEHETRAYPIQILVWHEIVNDHVAETPVAVTFCPLCNTALVFDRRVRGRVLDFGTTGNLRNSDLVMYDRQTESWWQQFGGEAIVGELTGTKLRQVPARIVAWRDFAASHPDGKVLSRETTYSRPYGENPYIGYDDVDSPPFAPVANADDDRLPPKERVVFVEHGGDAAVVPFSTLEETRSLSVEIGGEELLVSWRPGARSALDDAQIGEGREVGSVEVRTVDSGELVPFDTPFWFAVAAFRPDARIVE